MARPKKPLAAQKGHTTSEYRKKREQSEAGAKAGEKGRLYEEPKELINADAKKAWHSWVAYLGDKEFYGNVTIPELVGYCNAWAVNVRAWRKVKRGGLSPEEQSAVMKLIKESSEEMTRCMNRGGFSVNSRITIGEAMAREQADRIEGQFGEI